MYTCDRTGASAPAPVSSDRVDTASSDLAPGPEGSLQTLADYLTVGYWADTGRTARSYNVADSGTGANAGVLHYNVSGYADDTSGLTAERQALAREAFKLYEAVLGIDFVETTSTGDEVDIFFRDDDSGASNTSTLHAGTGGPIDVSVINVATDWSGGASQIGDYTFQTFLHEIGHALGLGHQGDYDGDAIYATDAIWANDSWQQSMMSYFNQSDNTSISASYARLITPMAVDWLALDDLYRTQGYGISQAFAGDTTWGFGGSIASGTSAAFAAIAALGSSNAFCIVDGGGTDTLDLSGFADAQVIDLTEASPTSTTGTISSVGGLTGNMTIAVGTIIENALGGAGDDSLTGNGAANRLSGNDGIDTLNGAGGDDLLLGGLLTDTVSGGGGDDTLRVLAGEFYDNSHGGTGEDTLDHSASTYDDTTFDFALGIMTGAGIDGASAALSGIETYHDGSGGNTVVSDGLGHSYHGHGGNDVMIAETGGEFMHGGSGVDLIDLSRGSDAHVVDMDTGSSDDGSELYLGFERLIAGAGDDTIFGTDGGNRIDTGAGDDVCRGRAGNDWLAGGLGVDRLRGGEGNDRFLYLAAADSTFDAPDRLRSGDGGGAFDGAGGDDGDRIDLSAIDADLTLGGHQSFAFGERGAGGLWCVNFGSRTRVLANLDDERGAEFRIDILDGSTFASDYGDADFLL